MQRKKAKQEIFKFVSTKKQLKPLLEIAFEIIAEARAIHCVLQLINLDT